MFKKHWQTWGFFTLLAGLILGPLLARGYILTLDLGWGPHFAVSNVEDNGYLLTLSLAGLTHVIPSWLVEKLVLASIFVLVGVGMQKFASRNAPGWPSFAAGTIYVINPFTYERFLAGQWLVLAGYALLPWVMDALLHVLERPRPRRAVVLAAWGTALAVVSLHMIAMAALAAMALCLAHAWGRWRSLRLAAPALGLAVALWCVAGIAWLAPTLTHRSATATAIAGFDADQLTAFATAPGPFGAPINVLTLQGFWGGARGFVALASSTGLWFALACLLMAISVVSGLILAIRQRNRAGLGLAAAALAAWVLAVGIAAPGFASVTHWLIAHVPLYRGYREPEKWVAILALAYSYLAALCFKALNERVQGFWRGAAAISAFLLPIIWTPLMLWGAAGQLQSVDYPASWYQLDQKLSALAPAPASDRPDTLILPWHQYMYLDFARRTVANPAANFFSRPVITSNDPELPGVPPPSDNSIATLVQENVINRRFFEDNAGIRLSALGVHFIVLLKVADWPSNSWLAAQSDLTLVAETSDWQLYRTQDRQ